MSPGLTCPETRARPHKGPLGLLQASGDTLCPGTPEVSLEEVARALALEDQNDC